MKRTPGLFFLSTISILLVLVMVAPVLAQAPSIQVHIESVDASKFPTVDAYVSILDSEGLPLSGITQDQFTLFEDGSGISNITVSPFHNDQQPLAIALAVDTSGSMANYMSEVKKAARNFAGLLSPNDQMAIYSFSDSVTKVQDFTSDKNSLNTAIDSLAATAGTKLYDAMIQAIGDLKDRAERRAVVVITDGKDSSSVFTFDDVVNQANNRSIPIYMIGFGEINQSECQRIATLTSGSCQIQPDQTKLTDDLQTVLDTFREQYKLTYTSNLQADGKSHEMKVSVSFQGGSYTGTQQFIAQPQVLKISLPGFTDGQDVSGKIRFAPKILALTPPVTELDITIDGQPLKTLLTEPWEYVWDAGSVATGTHAIGFSARDSAGNTGQMTINLNVTNAIVINVTSPDLTKPLSGKINLALDISSLAAIARVDVLFDGAQLVELTQAPFAMDIDTTRLPAGAHTLRIVASDVNGYSVERTDPITIGVQGSSGIWFIGLIVVIGAAAIIIPLATRKRRPKVAKPAGALPGKGTSPVSAGQAVLVELKGYYPNREWPLMKPEVRIGRQRETNDILAQGNTASRQHAVIRKMGTQFAIVSLKAENPVKVNGKPLTQKALQPGDIIQVGDSLFKFMVKG